VPADVALTPGEAGGHLKERWRGQGRRVGCTIRAAGSGPWIRTCWCHGFSRAMRQQPIGCGQAPERPHRDKRKAFRLPGPRSPAGNGWFRSNPYLEGRCASG
jgi:hypothetical protein